MTQFLINLYVDFDFEGAQQKLAECETVLDNDFFLTALKVRHHRRPIKSLENCRSTISDASSWMLDHALVLGSDATTCLPSCASSRDLLLHGAAQDDFVENARLLIFETYCRIHQCIDLQV